MEKETFLAHVGKMTYAARMRHLVMVGKASRDDPAQARLIEELLAGDTYERQLALISCFGSLNGAQVVAGLSDISRRVRGLAIKVAAVACSDEQILAGLPTLPPKVQYKILVNLKRRQRDVPINAFIQTLIAQKSDHLSAVISLGSDAIVREQLPRLSSYANDNDWQRLAKGHPTIVVQTLQEWAERIPQEDRHLNWVVNAVLPILALSTPDEMLRLMEAMARTTALTKLNIWSVAQQRPNETVDFILRHTDALPTSTNDYRTAYGGWGYRTTWQSIVPRLTPDRLKKMLTLHSNLFGLPAHYPAWLRKLPPALRGELWTEFGLGWRDANAATPLEIVALLPEPYRAAEGKRHLALPSLSGAYLPYAKFLEWETAQAKVADALSDQEAEVRTEGWKVLTGAVHYKRDHLGDLLTMMEARRYEQDPVRLVMMYELARVPVPAFQEAHLPMVGQLIQDALNAADLSNSTVQQTGILLLRLLPTHTDWALTWLVTLAQRQGYVFSNSRMLLALPLSKVAQIVTALLPTLYSWKERLVQQSILFFAQNLGPRLTVNPALPDLLESLLDDQFPTQTNVAALQILLMYDRDRATRLIPQLIQTDPSWMTQRVVFTYVHRHRQDLLTPFLGQKTFGGRFFSDKVIYLLPLYDGFHRWTPDQQRQFARSLMHISEDDKRDIPTVINIIRQLGALLYIPPATLIMYASDPREPVRVAALRALGRADAGQGIPTLLEALTDSRARFAIYALRHALLEMPKAQARSILNQVSLERVTVAKEVLRLLGELGTEEAYQDLVAASQQPLHRDVRAALVRALWGFLGRTQTWDMLRDAAQSEEIVVASLVSRTPTLRLGNWAQVRLLEILVLLLEHPKERVRQRVFERIREMPVADPEGQLQAGLERGLFSLISEEVTAAAHALFAMYAGRAPERIAPILQRLLPRRQALATLLSQYGGMLRWQRERLEATTRVILGVLTTDPMTLSWQVWLRLVGLPWAETLAWLENASPPMLTGRVVSIIEDEIKSGWLVAVLPTPDDTEQQLAAHPLPVVRSIGLTLLKYIAHKHGWTEARIERLLRYRRDASVEVAEPAQFLPWTGEPISAE